jgi:hypothetical protein
VPSRLPEISHNPSGLCRNRSRVMRSM